MRHSRFACILVFTAAVGLFLGCGKAEPKRYGVTGTVKYKDKLIEAGSITFIPDGGDTKLGGAQIKDGKYEFPAQVGFLAGKYKVSISYPDPKGTPAVTDMPGAGLDAKNLIPAKYNDNTELKAEVEANGKNVFDFDLK